jgi:hypothetical protein
MLNLPRSEMEIISKNCKSIIGCMPVIKSGNHDDRADPINTDRSTADTVSGNKGTDKRVEETAAERRYGGSHSRGSKARS